MDQDLINIESMIAARNAANWSFWAMLGTWFSGIATLSAVLFSLITVRKNTRFTLVAKAGFRTEITKSIKRSVLYFKVVNHGIPTCHISGIGWVILKRPRFIFKIFNRKEHKRYWAQISALKI